MPGCGWGQVTSFSMSAAVVCPSVRHVSVVVLSTKCALPLSILLAMLTSLIIALKLFAWGWARPGWAIV